MTTEEKSGLLAPNPVYSQGANHTFFSKNDVDNLPVMLEQKNTMEQLVSKLKKEYQLDDVEVEVKRGGNISVTVAIKGLNIDVSPQVRSNTFRYGVNKYLAPRKETNLCCGPSLAFDETGIITTEFKYTLDSKSPEKARKFIVKLLGEKDADLFFQENARSCCSIV